MKFNKIIKILLKVFAVIIIIDYFLFDFISLIFLIAFNDNEKYTSPEEYVQAREKEEYERQDTSLDYCPPYELVYQFDYDNKTVILYSYHFSFDGVKSSSYAIEVLKHNKDNTYTPTGYFTELNKYLKYDDGYINRYESGGNIFTKWGTRNLMFVYLPGDSTKDVYIDGRKAKKIPVTIGDDSFYICYVFLPKHTLLRSKIKPEYNIKLK